MSGPAIAPSNASVMACSRDVPVGMAAESPIVRQSDASDF